MFKRPHHQRIAHVLAQHHCWFGGGTCIALRYGEYRESVDIDFLISDAAGYREIRQMLTGHGHGNTQSRSMAKHTKPSAGAACVVCARQNFASASHQICHFH
jgi:hypothetical protein